MTTASHGFRAGDRVRATNRPGFPAGTVVKLMDGGYLLVRWDGDVLETAHCSELAKIAGESTE
jgi:hypothetical protein